MSSKKANKVINWFLEADSKLSDRHDKSNTVSRLVAVSYPVSFLMDRFKVDINDGRKPNTGLQPSTLIHRIEEVLSKFDWEGDRTW